MPAVRFARDKRGYEYVYLVHTPQRRGKPGRQRVLYWYRTPPGVTIGRKPFDVDVQRALERQYPGVTFDWNTIVSTPMPPPDMTEYWRERRRAERAAKLERRAAEAAEAGEAGEPITGAEVDGDNGAEAREPSADAPRFLEVSAVPLGGDDPEPGVPAVDAVAAPGEGTANGEPASGRRRRRRRGGRRRASTAGEGGAPAVSAAETGPESTDGQADAAAEPDTPDSTSEEQ